MPVKKILIWALVIVVAYYLVTQPSGAAHTLGTWLTDLKNAGNDLGKFISGLQ